MESTENYQVKLEFFEGPLDLLLFLIKKQKIDINDIPISTITKKYLEYLEKKEKINLNREGEFLLMAALLIYIKSQMLLPREPELKEEDEEDPRQTLVERLLDYQKIKTVSTILKKKESEEQLKWKRTSLPYQIEDEERELEDLSLFELAERFFSLMKRKEKENIQLFKGKEFTIEDKMKEIIELLKENSYLDFLDYFYKQESLEEALFSFFSLLELQKAKIIILVQKKLFNSIKVWFAKDYYSGKN